MNDVPAGSRSADGAHTLVQLANRSSDDLGEVLRRYDVRVRARIIAAGVYRDVDDVAQEVNVRILAAANKGMQWHDIASFRAWVHLVARSAAVDHLRKEGRQPRNFDSGIIAPDSSAGHAVERVAGDTPSPSLHAMAREQLESAREQHERRLVAIADLREPDQVLLAMWETGGLSWSRIAEEMGRQVGKALTEDQMRMRYRRIVERVGERVDWVDDSP